MEALKENPSHKQSLNKRHTKGLHSPTLDEAKDYIYSVDFSYLITKMMYQGWLKRDALQACNWYRNFLFLNKKYGLKPMMPPSEDIDEVWHNHILFTENYRKDCNAIFGRYLDHKPSFGIDDKSTLNLYRAFKRTQDLHHKEFGEQLYEIRGIIKCSGIIRAIVAKFNERSDNCVTRSGNLLFNIKIIKN